MTNKTPLEYDECVAFTDYMELRGLTFSHIANETFTRNWGTKIKNKKMGVRRGVPDYIILTKKNIIFLEMKRQKGGRLSQEQEHWLNAIQDLKIPRVIGAVCYGADEAIAFVEQYLK